MKLSVFVDEINKAARFARSEAKLEGEINNILKKCLNKFGINFDPSVNETLSSLGLSQVNSDRPDGVFGHIVYDYKAPKLFTKPIEVRKAKKQIEKYLNTITNGGPLTNTDECSKWFGYIFDGFKFFFCRSNSQEWNWSKAVPISENSLYFIIHVYRALRRKPLSPILLSNSLGKKSEVARETIRIFCAHLSKPKHKTNMLFREWRRLFQQVSTYGLDQLPSLKEWAKEIGIATKDASYILFAMHTYYSIVVKLLTSELLTISSSTISSICETIAFSKDDEKLYSILNNLENSEYYKKYRISNFLEGDFFSWYLNEKSKNLSKAIRDIALTFLDFEPASALLRPEMKKDLLKEFYSSLVDEQIRHDLGEYYTPDWLAQHLINQTGFNGNLHASVLDPACGSGTFLVECINITREYCETNRISRIDTLKTIINNIKGLDLNPLAVISARANYILSIYDLVFELGYDIEIPVYLADSINVPVEKKDKDEVPYLEFYLSTEVEDFTLGIPLSLVKSQVLSKILLICEESVIKKNHFKIFIKRLKYDNSIAQHLSGSVVDRLENFYNKLLSLEKRDWDKIWCRIIKNNFSPKGFFPFKYIVGNPPWVRWSRLPENYRNRVKSFCNYYGLVSGRGYSGGIESDISTVITFSAADNWLAKDGIIAFLITWTVFKSDSAKGFRLSYLPNKNALKIMHIEDLTNIQPFPDATNATSLFLSKKVNGHRNAKFSSINCDIWIPQKGKSRIPSSLSLNEVYKSVNIKKGIACPIGDWGSPFYTGEKVHYINSSFLKGSSEYLNHSHRGTISDCARIYWVKVEKYSPETNRALIRTLSEEELTKARMIDPVDGAWIEADLLYPLVRGRDVGRFSHKTEGWYQLIPNFHYESVQTEELFADQYPLTYSYLKNFEEILSKRSTYKRYQKHLPFYVIYCVGNYCLTPYKVVWPEQQNPSNFQACVVSNYKESIIPNQLLIPDHKLYYVNCDDINEAHYLCGFLNSEPASNWLGGFLLGKQIGTAIFQFMKVPKFNQKNPLHDNISNLSIKAHIERENSIDNTFLDNDTNLQLSQFVKEICGSESVI